MNFIAEPRAVFPVVQVVVLVAVEDETNAQRVRKFIDRDPPMRVRIRRFVRDKDVGPFGGSRSKTSGKMDDRWRRRSCAYIDSRFCHPDCNDSSQAS